ncbi:hypothetical protein DH2020_020224 [Rehmannia glutinosa]|uniref:Reverse transcriptase domain-containing protein n=1 Tax=Rehmannia glutinosa TaxID=99300 RepID=A0ABR0WKA8_REHGL
MESSSHWVRLPAMSSTLHLLVRRSLAMTNSAMSNEYPKLELSRAWESSLTVPSIGRFGGLALLWKNLFKFHFAPSVTASSTWIWFSEIIPSELRVSMDNLMSLYAVNFGIFSNHSILSRLPRAWICFGDFNEVLTQAEFEGSGPRATWQIEAFRSALDFCDLQDMGFKGNVFTWSRLSTFPHTQRARLDRSVRNESFRTIFPHSKVTHHESFTSDHKIHLITSSTSPSNLFCPSKPKIKPFRFEAMWIRSSKCEKIINDSCVSNTDNIEQNIENCKLCRLLVSTVMDESLVQPFTGDEVKDPDSITQFRPISLCNVTYKIAPKGLALRLRSILLSIISESQSAFVPGRLITDNILVAYEMHHSMKLRKSDKLGHMSINLDMSKAFGRIKWCFILRVLEALGFSEHFVSLIRTCITTPSFSFLLNGSQVGSLKPNRGIRQGDPLSPYLSIICYEVFSLILQDLQAVGKIHGIAINRFAPIISHLFFADDTLLFGHATVEEASNLRFAIKLYEEVWCMVSCPSSLLARMFKAKYFPASNVFLASLGTCPSWSWRSIFESIQFIKLGCRKLIKFGSSTHTWRDPWLPIHSDFCIHSLPPASPNVSMVVDLIDHDNGTWESDMVHGLFAEEESRAILSIPLSSCRPNDTWGWHFTKSGKFTVRSAYHMILKSNLFANHHHALASSSSDYNSIWRKIWKLRIPPRTQLFIWRCLTGSIATSENLQHHHLPSPSPCLLCGIPSATASHVFVLCPFAELVWKLVGLWETIIRFEQPSFQFWIADIIHELDKDACQIIVTVLTRPVNEIPQILEAQVAEAIALREAIRLGRHLNLRNIRGRCCHHSCGKWRSLISILLSRYC